jgi:hypothetical protein
VGLSIPLEQPPSKGAVDTVTGSFSGSTGAVNEDTPLNVRSN